MACVRDTTVRTVKRESEPDRRESSFIRFRAQTLPRGRTMKNTGKRDGEHKVARPMKRPLYLLRLEVRRGSRGQGWGRGMVKETEKVEVHLAFTGRQCRYTLSHTS